VVTDEPSLMRIPVIKGGAFRTIVILLGGFFSVAFIALTLWTSDSAQQNAMTRLAHSYSGAVMSFRAYYAETVVGRVGGLVAITHDYHENPHALPIPATMALELVDYMNLRDQSLAIAQISDYPFPWRADRVLTEGQRTALDALLISGEDMLTWTTRDETGRALHHAMAIRMEETCVGCHNSHPDSPRRDWKVGDLRAIQVVTVPFQDDGLLGNDPLRITAGFVFLSFVIALFALFVMDSRVRRFLGLARDSAIERAEAATALEEQARNTQAVLDNVLDGIITIDQSGIVASFSASAQRIFGYSDTEVVGQNVSMLMPQPYRSEHDRYLARYLATGVARVIGIGREVTGRRKDGKHLPLELSISETTHNGRPLFIGIVRDITERKRVEQLKNEFVSKVSHELRTPLTSIAGSLRLLAGGAVGQLPEKARQLVDIAWTNSNRLTRLIDDLLDMEKMAAGKLLFDLRTEALIPLLHQALESNQAYAEQLGVRLTLRECGTGVAVSVDRWRLMQVLSNLLSNAAKYAPRDSVVEVSACVHERLVRVAVKDSGPGIPEEFHDGVFQRFSQADSSDSRQKGGTGLGLAITKELVEHMGGEIGFESTPGAGATFYFDLPIVDPSTAPGDTATSPDTTHRSTDNT
jgi:PAS domain S-box-containing protein